MTTPLPLWHGIVLEQMLVGAAASLVNLIIHADRARLGGKRQFRPRLPAIHHRPVGDRDSVACRLIANLAASFAARDLLPRCRSRALLGGLRVLLAVLHAFELHAVGIEKEHDVIVVVIFAGGIDDLGALLF